MPMTRHIIALLTFFLFISPSYAADNTKHQRHIEVSGHGQIYAAPDIARLTLTFSQRDIQTTVAKNAIDSQVNQLLTLARKLAIQKQDVQAAQFTIYPQYDRKNKHQLNGYNVSREVHITLRDLSNYPLLLEGSVALGASHIKQPQFDFSNRKTLENKALQAAFKDAQQQAHLLAKVAGDKLGKTLWIHASGGHAPMRMGMLAESFADTNYPTGEIALTRQIQVRFALQD
jgi:hypothetical protein